MLAIAGEKQRPIKGRRNGGVHEKYSLLDSLGEVVNLLNNLGNIDEQRG